MPIYLYSMPWSPPCRAVLLLAENLGLEIIPRLIDTRSKDHLKPEFVKVNPQHCVPTLDDNGFILWESRAILCYLVDQYGKNDSLYPKDPKKRALVNQRLYFDIGTLFPRLKQYFISVAFHGKDPDESQFQQIQEAVGFLEKFLEGQQWVAGDALTIADYNLLVSVADIQSVGLVLSSYPNVSRWFHRAKAAIKGTEEQIVEQSRVFGRLFQDQLKK
uniref:Glutathione S-transferase n=1 Tax=Timema douglasi TaxID=61478 RepID=A0A7R8VKZ4_TIMDO|nr:unnamed protein product [Timema douglasi]